MNLRKLKKNQTLISSTGSMMLLLTLSLLGGCGGGVSIPEGFDDDFRLLVPSTPVGSALSDIDGLKTDPKWADSFRLEMIDGDSTNPLVVTQGVADSNYFYLHFEIEENDLTSSDMVVIALDPLSVANDKRLLIIKPCPSGPAGCPATGDNFDSAITYHINSDGDNEWELAAGHGVVAKSSTTGGNSWALEVAIPRGAPFNLSSTGYFGFYANIIETTDIPEIEIATQYTWPFNNDAGSTIIFGTAEDIPLPGVWGIASFNTSVGNGVSISSADISTNHGPSTISWNQPNTFRAIARNNTLTSGNLVEAKQVSATFKWANFGLPTHSSFQRIPLESSPAPGNPTAEQNIRPTDSATYQLEWTVPAADRPFYQGNRHWCIQVELDSSDPSTVFYRRQAQHNMNFVETSSPFYSKPVIDVRGLKLREKLQQHDYILDEKIFNADKNYVWKSELTGTKKIADGTYRLSIDDRKAKEIGLAVLPPEKVLVPYREISLDKGITKIPVKFGQIITLMEPANFSAKPVKSSAKTVKSSVKPIKSSAELLATGGRSDITHENMQGLSGPDSASVNNRDVPSMLMGSWDGFKKSNFYIANGTSLKVPKGAPQLYLKSESKITLKNYVTDFKDDAVFPGQYLPGERFKDGIVGLGANLPTIIYHGKRNMGGTLDIDGKVFQVYQSAGVFGYIVTGKKAN